MWKRVSYHYNNTTCVHLSVITTRAFSQTAEVVDCRIVVGPECNSISTVCGGKCEVMVSGGVRCL